MSEFGLTKDERLSSKNDFELVYSSGKRLYSNDKKIKAFFLFNRSDFPSLVKIAVSIKKKSGKAVWRNRLRRLIKDSYRLNKKLLIDSIEDLNDKTKCFIIFSPIGFNQKTEKKVNREDVEESVKTILETIALKIKNFI